LNNAKHPYKGVHEGPKKNRRKKVHKMIDVIEFKNQLLSSLSFLPRGQYAIVCHIIAQAFQDYIDSVDKEIREGVQGCKIKS